MKIPYEVAIATLIAVMLGACSDGANSDKSANEAGFGSVGLELQLGPDVVLDSVHYELNNPNGYSKSGDIDVTRSGKISKVFEAIPGADDYSILLTADSSDGKVTCVGSAGFKVAPRTTSSVKVRLQCREPGRTGTVVINGEVNLCPRIDSLAATPDNILVNGSAQLIARARDEDNVPRPLRYTWTTTSGTLSSASAKSPKLTATVPGTATVTLTVSDGDCTDTWSVDVAVKHPNILLLVGDDLGYSDIAAFGGEIATPNLDALAGEGRIVTDHHSGALCAPTRSMLISGTDHHPVGLGRQGAGVGTQAGKPGYEGYLNQRAISVAELLKDNGYHTYIAGKWHLGDDADKSPKSWGYESSYVLLPGVQTHYNEFSDPATASEARQYRENGEYVTPPRDFFSADFYTDKLIEYIDANRGDGKPFYAFAAYTTPHWPLQAPDEFRDRYVGRYAAGYDVIRAERLARQKQLGLIPQDLVPNPLTPPSADRPTWAQLTDAQKLYEARRMEVYAAMVEHLDHNIGRLIDYLKSIDEYENTFIWFQSDNGAEGGGRDQNNGKDNSLANLGKRGSYVGVGPRWAEVSSTPFKLWKGYSTEGGVAVPAIARLPGQVASRAQFDGLTHVTDIVPTFLELAGVPNPGDEYKGREVQPISGKSLLPLLQDRASAVRDADDVVADELSGHSYVIRDHWKLVWLGGNLGTSSWQLFDLATDRAEINDVSATYPEVVAQLRADWADYVQLNGVIAQPPR